MIGQPPCARFAERAPRMGRRVELRESRARAKNVFTCASRRWIESIVRTRSRRQRGGVGRERSRTFVGFRCTLPRDHPVAKNTRETRARMCAVHHAREVVSRPRTPRTRNTRRMKEDRRDLSGRGTQMGANPRAQRRASRVFREKRPHWHTHLLRKKIRRRSPPFTDAGANEWVSRLDSRGTRRTSTLPPTTEGFR